MTTRRYLRSVTLAAGLAVAGCGGDEPPGASAPAPAPPKPPAASVPVACIVKWTSGTTGTLACTAGGPNKDRVKIDATTFRLDRICVNDVRIASYGAGGKTLPLATKPAGGLHCTDFGGVQQLPESCSCVPPAGGDCNPPPNGFTCVAAGYVPLAS
jgi:hypothetical protein